MTLPERPFSLLPRWAAVTVLLLTLFGCVWNVFALDMRDSAHEADIEYRLERSERTDMDLYRAVNRRVADGEDYYHAAADEHRRFGMPTSPFVTMRTPMLAWTNTVWGEQGWRIIAAVLWGANILVWFVALRGDGRIEALCAAAMAGFFGMVAFIPDIPFSHEILAGLMLSLALALSTGGLWIGALILTICAVSLRELALPFLIAWGGAALLGGERGKLLAIGGALALLVIGLLLHAYAVGEVRRAGDFVSPGWRGLFGPGLAFYGIHLTTLLQTLPVWCAGPLGVLPLLGWFAKGGKLGAFASLWFAGFIAAVAIFARQENFYWMGLFIPAYGVGLAFVPRALSDLMSAIRRQPSASPMHASR